ncbi:MAG TPA: hypothetical protein VIR58_04715, partial [Acidimicrobiales bacterium]
EAAVGRGGVRRDAAEARRARVAKSKAAAEAHDHSHDGPHTHDEHGNAIPLDADAAAEVPGEPTEATIEQAEEVQADDAGDLTDEVVADAENEVPGEPSEAVIEAVEEAADEAQATEDPEASSSDEETK